MSTTPTRRLHDVTKHTLNASQSPIGESPRRTRRVKSRFFFKNTKTNQSHFRRRARRGNRQPPVFTRFYYLFVTSCRRRVDVVEIRIQRKPSESLKIQSPANPSQRRDCAKRRALLSDLQNPIIPRTYARRPQTLASVGFARSRVRAKKSLDFSFQNDQNLFRSREAHNHQSSIQENY